MDVNGEAEDEEISVWEGFQQEDLADAMLDMFEEEDEKDLDWLPPKCEIRHRITERQVLTNRIPIHSTNHPTSTRTFRGQQGPIDESVLSDPSTDNDEAAPVALAIKALCHMITGCTAVYLIVCFFLLLPSFFPLLLPSALIPPIIPPGVKICKICGGCRSGSRSLSGLIDHRYVVCLRCFCHILEI